MERWHGRFVPPDPNLDYHPQGSGYVISTPDYRGVELARQVLPRGNAYLYVVGPPPSQLIYDGRAEPAPFDDDADAFEDVDAFEESMPPCGYRGICVD